MSESYVAFGRFGFPRLGRFWTPSNTLSMFRLLLGIPILLAIIMRGPSDPVALILVLLAVVTDWLDGKLARWSKTVSEWGKVLDPIADKVVGALTVLALTIRGDTVFQWWFIALLLVRDVLIVGGAMIMSRRKGRVFMSLWSGKLMVTFTALTVLAVLLEADPPIPQYLLWISTGFVVYSFFRYLLRFITYMRYGDLPPAEPAPEAGPLTAAPTTGSPPIPPPSPAQTADTSPP